MQRNVVFMLAILVVLFCDAIELNVGKAVNFFLPQGHSLEKQAMERVLCGLPFGQSQSVATAHAQDNLQQIEVHPKSWARAFL